MSSKPILFNTEMVKAILDGRKTQTRRVIPLKNNDLIFTGFVVSSTAKNREGYCAFGKNKEQDLEFIKPKYKVGDVLYVKETFNLNGDCWGVAYPLKINYKADSKENGFKWISSNIMRKEYARIFLKVTNVRVERLQDIILDDIEKEGFGNLTGFYNHDVDNALDWWEQLWNSTAKDGYKWEDNPYVFVYEFERIHNV